MAPMKTTDFQEFLKPAEIDAIFEETRRQSVVQQLARQVTMGQHGTSIPVWTGKPTAGFVGEAEAKPTSEVSATVKKMTPEKLAVIVPVSAELVRANPLGVIQHAQADMVEALAIAFDNAVLHGINSPYGNNTLSSVTNTAELDTDGVGAYNSFNGILRTLVSNGKKLTGFALDSQVEPDLNVAVDGTGKSIFVESATDANSVTRQGRLLGRNALMSDHLASADGSVLGFAGDFSQIIWGQVASIQVDVTDTATIDLTGGGTLNLWQQNMLALRAEVEYGVFVNDLASFVKVTQNTPAV